PLYLLFSAYLIFSFLNPPSFTIDRYAFILSRKGRLFRRPGCLCRPSVAPVPRITSKGHRYRV
ncbi:hypothetical protein DM02DRAFT_678814, partial [Periconia macrospinosa]